MDNTSFAPGNNSINNSVPPSTPQYSLPEHKHFLNKKFIITFVILLLLAGGAYAGIWYWQKQQVAQEVVPTFTPRADVTAGWKTFSNQIFSYQLKYPNTWVVDTTYSNTDFSVRGGGDVMGGDTYWQNYSWSPKEPTQEPVDHMSLYLIVYRDQKNKTIEDWAQANYGINNKVPQGSKLLDAQDFKTQTGTIGRQYSLETIDHPVGVKSVITIFQKGDSFYVFNSPWQSKDIDNQILSTFKFTDSIQGQTMCTQEAKQCPDGSYVGRTGPNCAFAACP